MNDELKSWSSSWDGLWPAKEPMKLCYFEDTITWETAEECAGIMETYRKGMPANTAIIVVRNDGTTLKVPCVNKDRESWTGADMALMIWEFLHSDQLRKGPCV